MYIDCRKQGKYIRLNIFLEQVNLLCYITPRCTVGL